MKAAQEKVAPLKWGEPITIKAEDVKPVSETIPGLSATALIDLEHEIAMGRNGHEN